MFFTTKPNGCNPPLRQLAPTSWLPRWHMSASGSESIGSDDDDEDIGPLAADALLVSGSMSLLTGPHHGEILQVFTRRVSPCVLWIS